METSTKERPNLTVELQKGKPVIVEKKDQIKDSLFELGFKNASSRLQAAEKMSIAYERYMFITPEAIKNFNEKLRKETLREDKNAFRYKQLIFIAIENYSEIPPVHVLEKLKAAMRDECFDAYEICKIDWIEEIKDPILFGTIKNCSDKFYIAQWDDDIKIQDIISCNTDRAKSVNVQEEE